MNIDRYDFVGEDCWARLDTEGEYVSYEDYIKTVEEETQSLLEEVASLKAELATLMSSLETWDEEFK